MVKRWMIFAIIGSSLSGCMSYQVTGGGCPPLVQYSAATQRKAADELERLPKNSVIAQMITDYGKTRKACRIYQ